MSHLDNDKEEYRKDLEKFIESWIPIDKKDPHYVMEAKVGARIEFMELVEAHTQSKLKAFAEEVKQLIEKSKEDNLDYHGRPDCKNCSLIEDLEALKAIKGKYQL